MDVFSAPDGLRTPPAPDGRASNLLGGTPKSETPWRLVTTSGGELEVSKVQSILSVDFAAPGFGGLSVLPAFAVLDSGLDISSIPEPVLRQIETRSPGVQVRMPPEEDFRNVRLANSEIVTVTHKTVAPQLTVHHQRGTVALDPEICAVMSGCDPVCIVGRMTLDKLELSWIPKYSSLLEHQGL